VNSSKLDEYYFDPLAGCRQRRNGCALQPII
jgi:hypothetical protein